MERDAPPVLQHRIAEWRANGESDRVVTLLAKTEVLNDSMMAHVPDLLTLDICDSVLNKKPKRNGDGFIVVRGHVGTTREQWRPSEPSLRSRSARAPSARVRVVGTSREAAPRALPGPK